MKSLFLLLLFGFALIFSSCSLLDEDDKDDEPFKSMYDDKTQMILTPLAVGYTWVFEETEYGEGTTTSYDTISISEKRVVNGVTIYVTDVDGDYIEGLALVGDTLYLEVGAYNGMIDYNDGLAFYLSTSLRNAYDLHNGSATYEREGYTYELTGAVDEHQVELLSGTVTVTGTTYMISNMYETMMFKFADWRNSVDTFFGPVNFSRYNANGGLEYEMKLIHFEHPF